MANNKQDPGILLYCAKSLHPLINDLNRSAQHILKRNDIEDIHDLRVASRRIRAVIDSFEKHLPKKQVKTWKKGIRAITKSFGKVRDIDVQLDLINRLYAELEDRKIRSGVRRVRLRLEQRRKAKQEHTAGNTKTLLESAVIIDLSEWVTAILSEYEEGPAFSSGLYQLGYQQIQSRLDDFLFYEVFIFDSSRIKELHAMRISAKKLRYALEIFSELYAHQTDFALKVTKKAQDYLGEIHDCDVWIEFLPKFMQKEHERIKEFYGYTRPYRRIRPGIEYLIDNRKQERQALYQAFLNDWKKWKMEETWLNLRKVIFLTSLETQAAPQQEEQIDEHESGAGPIQTNDENAPPSGEDAATS